MTQLLWLLLPEGAEVLVLVGVAAALMLGLISPRRAAAVVLTLVAMLVLAPFLPGLLDLLPTGILLLVVVLVGAYTARVVLEAVLGRSAAGRVMATLFLGALRLPFRVVGGMIRVLLRPSRPPRDRPRRGPARPPQVVFVPPAPGRARVPRTANEGGQE